MLHALVDLWNDDIDQKLGVEQARGPNKMRVSLPFGASVFAPLNKSSKSKRVLKIKK